MKDPERVERVRSLLPVYVRLLEVRHRSRLARWRQVPGLVLVNYRLLRRYSSRRVSWRQAWRLVWTALR